MIYDNPVIYHLSSEELAILRERYENDRLTRLLIHEIERLGHLISDKHFHKDTFTIIHAAKGDSVE